MLYTGIEWKVENRRLKEFESQLSELDQKYNKTVDDYKDIAELIGRISELKRFIAFIDRIMGD